MSDSLAQTVANLPIDQQQAWLDALDEDVVKELAFAPWWFVGRPEQIMPEGDWSTWLILAGRRWGKTASGAENLLEMIVTTPVDAAGQPTVWGIFAPNFEDARKVCVEGPSGLLRALRRRPDVGFNFDRSKWQISFEEGQVVYLSGANNPDVGRGPTLSGLWADELAKWPYYERTWSEGIDPSLSNKLPDGKKPRAIITTTPKPGNKLLKQWISSPYAHVTRGKIDENRANLDPASLARLHDLYDGTRVGLQELSGEMLEDVEGALWVYEDIIVANPPKEFKRIVVAVDPSISNTENSDECGIVVCARAEDDSLWVLDDRSIKADVNTWAARAISAFQDWSATVMCYEPNQGGDMTPTIVHQTEPYIPMKPTPAYQGKRLRAEPIANLYQQHKVFHAQHFDKLETQMCTWEPYDKGAKSPDRVDALVHALTELAPTVVASRIIAAMADVCPSCKQFNTKGVSVCAYCSATMS